MLRASRCCARSMRCANGISGGHNNCPMDGPVPPLIVLGTSLLLAAVRHLALTSRKGWNVRADAGVVGAIVAVAMLLELGMGRSPTYAKGPVRLWSGDIHSDQNSQQILDPYSFTHVVH